MKLKPVMLSFLIASLLSVHTHSAERQGVFHSEANGYSIAIPEGWKLAPVDNVQNEPHSIMRLLTQNEVRNRCEAKFVPDTTEDLDSYPSLIVNTTGYQELTERKQHTKKEIAFIAKGLAKIKVFRATQYFDEKRMALSFVVHRELPGIGRCRYSNVGHFGKFGIVELDFQCLETNWPSLENDYRMMLDSFAFDVGMRYEDAPKELGISNKSISNNVGFLICGYIGYGMLIWLGIGWTYGVRVKLSTGIPTIIGAMFLLTSAIVIGVLGINKLHSWWLLLVGYHSTFLTTYILAGRVPILFEIVKLIASRYARIVRLGIPAEKVKSASEADALQKIDRMFSDMSDEL